MTAPLAGTIGICAFGVFALAVRLLKGLSTDPFVWLIVIGAFCASCFIAYENSAGALKSADQSKPD